MSADVLRVFLRLETITPLMCWRRVDAFLVSFVFSASRWLGLTLISLPSLCFIVCHLCPPSLLHPFVLYHFALFAASALNCALFPSARIGCFSFISAFLVGSC